MKQSKTRHVTITLTVTGFGGYSPHEHNTSESGLGLLARWRDVTGVETDAIAFAPIGRAAYVDLSGLQPGDQIAVTGSATLIELPPFLPPTVVIDVTSVQALNRAPQAWQRSEPA